MHCKNLYELSVAEKMMCYDSLAHMSPFFTIEGICIGLKNLASQRASNLQCIKVEILKWTGKEAHVEKPAPPDGNRRSLEEETEPDGSGRKLIGSGMN